MRLDYPLYGLAVVLFALTAINYLWVAEESFKIFYVTSTAIVGVLALVGGYFLRPKTAAEMPDQQAAAPQAPAEQPTSGAIVEAPTTQMQVAEPPKVEVPAVQAPAPVEAAPPTAQPVAPQAKGPMIEATAPAAPVAAKTGFSQIHGINEKRVEQLKAAGINTVEEMANASADDLAVKLGVSPKIVKMWIGSAKKLAK